MDGFFNENDNNGFFSISSISFGDNVYRTVRYSATLVPELQMPNENLTCPRCGTTIHNVQKTRMLGCLNCYTVFNGQIGKLIKLIQPDSTYEGRGIKEASVEIDTGSDEVTISDNSETVVEDKEVPPVKAETLQADNSEETRLDRLSKADLGMLSDDELMSGMKLAASHKEYILANKLKEELNSRKG